MSMGGASSRDKLQSDINVTPLVDVCLVLLIIFMVVTPLLQKGIAVQLPTTDNPDKKPENASQKLLTVGWATPPAYYFEADKLSKADIPKATVLNWVVAHGGVPHTATATSSFPTKCAGPPVEPLVVEPPIVEPHKLSRADIQKRLDELYQRSPNADIIIKADQRLKYGDVKEVMRMAKEAGFQNVGLIADKKQKGAAPKS